MALPHSTTKYRAVKGFPDYDVGTDGSVWSWKRGKVRKLKLSKASRYGHLKVNLCHEGKRWDAVPVHRLVLETFVGPCPEGMECCHNDGNPSNNQLDNLRWDTRQGNNDDRVKHGSSKGERNPKAKLTEDDVREIRRLLVRGWGQPKIAVRFKVTSNTISAINRGHIWRFIE
jgi:hypothetical protein